KPDGRGVQDLRRSSDAFQPKCCHGIDVVLSVVAFSCRDDHYHEPIIDDLINDSIALAAKLDLVAVAQTGEPRRGDARILPQLFQFANHLSLDVVIKLLPLPSCRRKDFNRVAHPAPLERALPSSTARALAPHQANPGATPELCPTLREKLCKRPACCG